MRPHGVMTLALSLLRSPFKRMIPTHGSIIPAQFASDREKSWWLAGPDGKAFRFKFASASSPMGTLPHKYYPDTSCFSLSLPRFTVPQPDD